MKNKNDLEKLRKMIMEINKQFTNGHDFPQVMLLRDEFQEIESKALHRAAINENPCETLISTYKQMINLFENAIKK